MFREMRRKKQIQTITFTSDTIDKSKFYFKHIPFDFVHTIHEYVVQVVMTYFLKRDHNLKLPAYIRRIK